jgi:hypothetical protein
MKKMKEMKKEIWGSLLFLAVLSTALLCAPGASLAAPAQEALSMTKLTFVQDVAGLGQYTPKQGARFAIGDICTLYVEATGFTLKPKSKEEDEFDLDLAVDVAIRRAQGKRAIVSEKDISTMKTSMRSKLPSTFLAFSFLFDQEWDPDAYAMELTLRDNLSSQSVTQTLNFQLDEPTQADLTRQAEEGKGRQAQP